MPQFLSRTGLWLIRVAVAVPAILMIGWPIWELAECGYGDPHVGACTGIPDGLGNVALLAFIAAFYFGLFVSPVLIGAGGLLEWLARRKER